MASCGPLHTCELCGQDGLSETEMRSHMQLVHVEGSPACPFCDLADLSHSEMVSCNLYIQQEIMSVNKVSGTEYISIGGACELCPS